MKELKQTIKGSISYTGIGLHSGEITTITFKPAEDDTGIIFIRTDLEGSPEIPAVLLNKNQKENISNLTKLSHFLLLKIMLILLLYPQMI